MAEVKFYPQVDLKYGENAIDRALASNQINKQDAELIRTYIAEYQATKHVKEHRALKTTYDLVNWRRFIKKPYADCQAEDVFFGINAMQKGKSLRGAPFADNTKHDYVKGLKKFLKWLIENEYSTIPEKKIQPIKIPAKNMETTSPDEILTDNEVLAIITACKNSRDRAIVSTLYESGCRIGELARIRWKNLVFDEYGIKCHIDDQKTRKRRFSRLTMSTQYLSQWRADYPVLGNNGLPDDEAFVFVTRERDGMEYRAISQIIERAAKRANIGKDVHPHLFRKTRITHMINQNYQESVVKQSMWGNLGTKMFEIYLRQSAKDIDQEFLRKAGVITETESQKEKDVLKPRPCPYCHEVNGPHMRFCGRCGGALTEEARASVRDAEILADNALSEILEHPEDNIQLLKRFKKIMDSLPE